MTRSDLIQRMAMRNPTLNATNIPKILDTIFEAIADYLANDGRVELRGFGSFSTRVRTARPGMNPRTGERVAVEAKRLVYFRPGKQMHEAINADVGTTKAAGRKRPPS